MRKTLILLIMLPLVAFGQSFLREDTSFALRKAQIDATQRQEGGKYKQTLETDDGTGIIYRVDEYVSPKGPGYALIYFVTKGNMLWMKATYTGPESYRSFDWGLIEE